MRLLLLLTLATQVFSQALKFNYYPLDKYGNEMMVAGAQVNSIGIQGMVVTSSLSAGNTLTISSSDYNFFRVPAGTWTSQVSFDEDNSGTGQNCLFTFTSGTANSMTWTLGKLNGACNLPTHSVWQFLVPADFAQPNPPPGYYKISASVNGIGTTTYQFQFNGYAVIYATADPRNSDNSASYLVGGGQPSFLNVGFTTTWNVTAGAVIQLMASTPAFRRPGQNTYAIPFPGTGCTATLTTTGTGATSQLRFTLSGASCLFIQNSGVGFSLPADLLSVHPVATQVSITINVIIGGTTYQAKNGNPGMYTTSDGCNAWSAWSSCSATCGSGYTYHTRPGNSYCSSTTIESRVCNTISCGCKPWGAWGSCSATCGGTISRSRTGSRGCNVATVDTQQCGPRDCDCPWTQTACSSNCGCGVRTRTITPANLWSVCNSLLQYDVVCNETFTTESLACPCKDVPWQDRFGNTCSDYVNKQWCTITGDYGPGWDFTQPNFRSFEYRSTNGNNALSACCGCGKNKCVKDTILLIDQSGSIRESDWEKTHKYIWDRVNQTKFTDEYGNRFAVLQFDVAASVLCPMTWNQTFLLNCIQGITFPAGPGTATSAALDLSYTVFDRYSSRNRTRVVELLTDGSPNIPTPDSVAEQAAFTSAYALKDAGVTILTIGMGVACASSTSSDCLNQDVLNTLASEPASSYAVLLSTYDSLKAMSLFISSQCQAKFAGFDPSPSPLPKYSPDISASPSPWPSPLPSSSPSPASNGCQDVPGWVSSTGNSCDYYRSHKWCENDTYGSGWPCQWGTFANWGVNGIDASTACCGCRGVAGTTPPPKCVPSPLPSSSPQASPPPSSSPVGCQDVPGWVSSTGNSCDYYRSHKWCENNTYGSGWPCQWGAFANWGVNGIDASTACCGCRGVAGTTPPPKCVPSPLPSSSPQASPPPSSSPVGCQDVPGWVSSTGNSCDYYRSHKWCENDTYGSGWPCQWGAFANWGVNGIDASTACCGCRGVTGTTPPPGCAPSPSPSSSPAASCLAQELLIPTDWPVQDVQGCSPDAIAQLLRSYECVQLQPSCGTFKCNRYVPPSVAQQIQSSCSDITP